MDVPITQMNAKSMYATLESYRPKPLTWLSVRAKALRRIVFSVCKKGSNTTCVLTTLSFLKPFRRPCWNRLTVRAFAGNVQTKVTVSDYLGSNLGWPVLGWDKCLLNWVCVQRFEGFICDGLGSSVTHSTVFHLLSCFLFEIAAAHCAAYSAIGFFDMCICASINQSRESARCFENDRSRFQYSVTHQFTTSEWFFA